MKTTIDVNKALAGAVARELGTRTLRQTIDSALREVLASIRRERLARRVASRTLPLPTAAELARLRAPRIRPGGLPGR